MSNSTLREALEQLIACHNEPECPAIAVARAALAADDATRGTMREQFEAWHRAEFPNDPIYRSEEYGYHREPVAERWRGWQASRAAAPVAEVTADDLVTLVGKDIAPMIDAGTLGHTISDTQSTACEVTARDVAVARALLFVVSGSALLDGDKKAIIDAGTLYRMVCIANNLLIGRLAPPVAPTDAEWQEEAMRLAKRIIFAVTAQCVSPSAKNVAKIEAAEDALRAHIATRPLPAPPTKTKESWQCLLCKSDLAGKHGVLDDGNTPCPNTKKEQP